MWFMLMTILGGLTLAAAAFLIIRFHRFSFFLALGSRAGIPGWLAACVPVALVALFALINVTTCIVVMLHLAAGFLLTDGLAALIRLLSGKAVPYDLKAGAALMLTALYLGAGWIAAHRVAVKEYSLATAKDTGGDLRFVLIADAHLGITQDGESFTKEMERVRALKPDAVFIAGDFVDDDSDAEDMQKACAALGTLDCPVYYVFGNHDGGYFGRRAFTAAALEKEFEKNGVTVLKDEVADAGGRFAVAGRLDRSSRQRKSAAELTEGVDPSLYTVMLDHQPNDYANEEGRADLVLSGHTHGGHIFPAGQIGLLMKANDLLYGHVRRGGTDFIVTSGISGWAIPFKTGCRSEIAVIDVRHEG